VAQPIVSAIIPFRNAADYLRKTAPSLVKAAVAYGSAEVIYVDNGSTDDSTAILQGLDQTRIRVVSRIGGTIAAVRNFGADQARGDFLAFLDADCLIEPEYFGNAVRVLERTDSAATGCEVSLPPDPHWIERVWDSLHYVGRDRPVHYLNSANFFIRRHVFEAVGRFDESLITGEDSEIGLRLTRSGHRILESTSVNAMHLGNPKSISAFFRRNVWHSVGMLAGQEGIRVDKPTAVLGVHLLLTLGAIAWVFLGSLAPLEMLMVVGLSQLVAPSVTVLFRRRQVKRRIEIAPSLYLYWLYYWARAYGLGLIVIGRDAHYRK
jgi:glycosyltransferase involved in cell wall biosynthesis